MHLNILVHSIVFAVISVSLQLHPSYFPSYPLIAIKPARVHDQKSSPEYYLLKPKFRPVYPMPEMKSSVFSQPLNEVSRAIVISGAPPTGDIANDTMPHIHQRLDTNFTPAISNTDSVHLSAGINRQNRNSSSSISFSLLPDPITTSAFCVSWNIRFITKFFYLNSVFYLFIDTAH